ncbi:hypothetical protein [Gandjariella thermophila]|uniref:Uncharacterized protein n=1 Tax=Gandjariella thermophila TaxID=1931992 RepID=A0A4D4J488_9PSEU|nr:hypothetical protein [Gandjariella thermophila]GDY28773.1 hypothetical protein GTS_04060 [Gandjariella thermophila]
MDGFQPALFGSAAIPAKPAKPADQPARSPRGQRGGSPQVAAEVLAEVNQGRYGVVDATDRIVVFEDWDRVRHAVEEDVIASLMAGGYVTQNGKDTVVCHHGAILRPVTPLRLTHRGRQLLSRWSALKPLGSTTRCLWCGKQPVAGMWLGDPLCADCLAGARVE